MPKAPRVLILNDTDEHGSHFGCMRVMCTIRRELELRQITSVPSIKVGVDWRRDKRALALIDAADLLIINGEGTLHHGKRRGGWLLEAGARVKARGGRVALLNALWQDNPDSWADLAREFDILVCRDSRSAVDLAAKTRREVKWIGDLSMFHDPALTTSGRVGITVGCSVSGSKTRRLAELAAMWRAEFMPVTTAIRTAPARMTGLRRVLRKMRCAIEGRLFLWRFPATIFVIDDQAYLEALSRRTLLVTGRFHAVCMAVLSGTPFLATSSNSWKIETLIHDIGLNPARLVSLDEFTTDHINEIEWVYTDVERAAIAERLAEWRLRGGEIFDSVVALIPQDHSISTEYSA